MGIWVQKPQFCIYTLYLTNIVSDTMLRIRAANMCIWKQKRLLLKCLLKYIQWEYEMLWHTVYFIHVYLKLINPFIQHKTSVPDALQADTDMGDLVSRGKVRRAMIFIEETNLSSNPVDIIAKHWWERACYSFLCSLVLKCFKSKPDPLIRPAVSYIYQKNSFMFLVLGQKLFMSVLISFTWKLHVNNMI